MLSGVPQPGEVVAGKYEVVRFLGKGGMGVVLEARHAKLGHRVALKLLLPEFTDRPDAVARFEREARAAAQLRSQHVVRVLDVDNDAARGGLPFIVMDYLQGHDLAYELKRRQFLPVAEAVDLMLQACIAFAEAHANGIVHRDIKPSNLFLEGAPQRATLKVMDFGVAKLVAATGETELTTTETALGTPSYMAPEQLTSSKTIDHRADIWALGVVAYRMLSGRLPFSADSSAALAVSILTVSPVHLRSAAPAVPPPLADAIMATLERDVTRRPQDAIALGRLLAPFGSGTVPFESSVATFGPPIVRQSNPQIPLASVDVEPTGNAWTQRDAPRPAVRSSAPIVAMAVGAVVLLVGVGVLGWKLAQRPSSEAREPAATSSVTASASQPVPAAPLPPPPSTAAYEPDPAPPTSTSVVVHSPPRPVKSAETARKPAAVPSAAPGPTKDPLHL